MSIVHLDIVGEGPGVAGASPASEAELVEGLRLRSADALERAYGFLQAQTDRWARLRADVLCEARPRIDLDEALAAVQEIDGSLPLGTLIAGGGLGFPPFDLETISPRAQKIAGTLEALLIAGDAKGIHAHWVEAAVRFLETCQDEDGAFRAPSGSDAASEASEKEAEIFWTGMIGGILGRTPVARPKTLESAGAFLASRFDPEAVEREGYGLLLAYSHFFTNVAHDLSDEALQWCGRALEKGFRSRHLDAVSTLRVLLTCDAQAMPGATFDVAELLERLLEEQAKDGGFAELCVEGPARRTTQTFDAMLAIVRLCAALGD